MQRPSDESSSSQLDLAREQGMAQQHAIEGMKTETKGHAAQTRAGDYLIGYAVEDAEGLYRWRDGELEWQEPTDENAHIEVVVCDPENGRFLPGLDVTVTVCDADGRELGSHRQPMLWHPWLYHYGRNWTLPGDGTYELRVHVDPLSLARHDKVNGSRFTKPVDVRFDNVAISTGRKLS